MYPSIHPTLLVNTRVVFLQVVPEEWGGSPLPKDMLCHPKAI